MIVARTMELLLSGMIFDAGPNNSPVLFQVGSGCGFPACHIGENGFRPVGHLRCVLSNRWRRAGKGATTA